MNILLVEDNRGDVILVQQALLEYRVEHELTVLRDGEEALRYIAEIGEGGGREAPDLLLLDLNLPRVEGSEVLRAFRARPECSGVPAIVLTSSDAPRDRAQVFALGISHYFRKPTDFDAFMAIGGLVRDMMASGGAKSG